MINYTNIVDTAMKIHARHGCIFAPGARERILEGTKTITAKDKRNIIYCLELLFRREEIYCPFEGIDRRHEFDGGSHS